MIAELLTGACLIIGHVDPAKKQIHTASEGCHITQQITPTGALVIERTDTFRTVTFSLPKSVSPYYFYYSFGDDSVCFDNWPCLPASQGFSGI